MPFKLFVLCFLCLLAATSIQAAKRDSCRLFLQVTPPSYLEPQGPHVPGYDNFVLAVTKKKNLILALAPYLGLNAHAVAARTIEARYESEIQYYLAAGELHHGEASYDIGNETSGFVAGQPRNKYRNSIANFERILRVRRPELISNPFEGRPFIENSNEIHLDPRLNCNDGHSDCLTNIRHDAGNDLQILYSSLPAIAIQIELYRSGQSQALVLVNSTQAIIQRNIHALTHFLALFEVDGYVSPRIRVLQAWLTRIENGERLSPGEYRALQTYLRAIQEGISDPYVRLIDLGFWEE